MKLRSKVLSFSIPLFLIPFLLIALAAYFFIVRTYETRERDQIESGIKDSISQIRRDFRSVSDMTASLADSPSVSGLLKLEKPNRDGSAMLTEIESYFENLVQRNPHILEIELVGTKRDEVVKISRSGFENKQRPEVFEQSLKEALLFGATQAPAFELDDGRRATAFLDSVGKEEFLGIVILIIDTRVFQSPLRNHVVAGNSLIWFDDRGVVLAQLSSRREDTKPSGELVFSFLSAAKNGKDLFGRLPFGENGEYASVFPLLEYPQSPNAARIPGKRWYLGVVEPYSAPTGLRIFQLALLSIVLTTVTAVIWLSVAGARRITKPIEQVSKATSRIAKGEHQLDLNVQTGDEVEELAKAVTKMNTELQERQKQIIESARLAAMGEMTSEISHEIQNRISGVSLWLQHLDAEVDQDDERREYIEEMKLGLAGFIDMLAGLKNYYRKPSLEKSDFDFGELQNEALASVEEAGATKRIEFAFEPSDIKINGDREKLKSVVLNLLINAVDASPDGGKVTIRTSIDESNFELQVEDQGAGIPESEIQKVFYPFYTTKSSGSGLGLAISKNIVDAHGGTLRVEKSGPDGTGFRVRIPVGTNQNGKNPDH